MRNSIVRLAALAPLSLLLLIGDASAQTAAPKTQIKTKAAAKAKSAAAPEKKLLDLNKATAEEMVDILPGVGEVTAKKIVDGRPYASVDDLAKAGVPTRTIAGIRSLVTVSAPASAPTAKVAKKAVPAKTAKAVEKPAVGHAAKVNLNTASLEELQTLPGIGPVYAKGIVDLRPIKKLSDLEKIKGLGSERIEELDEHVVILAAAPPAATPAPTSTAKTKKAAATKAAAHGDLKPGQTVNINKASADDLQLLPGIGPVKSQAIIDGRPYKTKADVMKVKGIKQGSFAKIEDLITVD